MTLDLLRLNAQLRRLRRADPQGKAVFGASYHRYFPHALPNEPAVLAFEMRRGVALPTDYRKLLLGFGDGGAGPFYGILPLGQVNDGYGHVPWTPRELVGDLCKPFPFTDAWNLTEADLDPDADEDEELTEDAIEHYWAPIDGAVPVCHEGYNLRDWLVVTGPDAGRIWHDARANHQGWRPVLDANGERATFGSWYRAWLREALLQIGWRPEDDDCLRAPELVPAGPWNRVSGGGAAFAASSARPAGGVSARRPPEADAPVSTGSARLTACGRSRATVERGLGDDQRGAG